MRHRLHKYRLRKAKDFRKAFMANLAISLFTHRRISTTLVRAKALRPYAEKMITKATISSSSSKLHVRRVVAARLFNNFDIADRLINDIAPQYRNRNGGYTRIVKSGFREGDGAPTAIIELV